MRLLLIITAAIFLFSACKDPGTIGAGLLGNEELEIGFTDTVYVKARVIPDDSTTITRVFQTMAIGLVDEPVFGNTTNQLFLGTSLNATLSPDFGEGLLDSLILRIDLDPTSEFGDPEAIHFVEVFQLDQEFEDSLVDLGDELDSTTELDFGDKIGEAMFVANYDSTVVVKQHCAGQDTSLAPHLRVRLDDDFGDQFMGLSGSELNDTIFKQLSRGLLVRNTPSTNAFLGLDFGSANGRLEFFYTDLDTTRCYQANAGLLRFLNVQHEHQGSGSEVETALNNPSDDHELLFSEPYAGVNIEFDLSGLKNFKDKIINNVSLEVTLAEVPGYDYDIFPAMENMSLSYRDENGDYRLISDITSTQGTIDDIEKIFGGSLEQDGNTGVMFYNMNITNHAIQLINGEFGDNYKLTLKGAFENSKPFRSIMHGNDGNGNGPKLKLVITEP